MSERVTDAAFEVVGGPYRIGEQHRERRGWYFTGRYDLDGTPLWYHPPPRLVRWARWVVLLALAGVTAATVGGIAWAFISALATGIYRGLS